MELKESELQQEYQNPEKEKKELQPEVFENMQFVADCFVDTDLELLIPDGYVENIPERINLYRKIDTLADEESINGFVTELTDRFGPLPKPVEELLEVVRLRWLAVKLGMEKIFLKSNKMTIHFVSDQQSLFYQSPVFFNILNQIQLRFKNTCRMQEKNGKLTLTFEQVGSVTKAHHLLEKMAGIN